MDPLISVRSLKYFNIEDVKKEINNINSKKATPKSDLSIKILMIKCSIMPPDFTEFFNQNINNSRFFNVLKNADISPVCKTRDQNSNQRPVSILQLVSKPFEQIDCHTKDTLAKYQGGFRKLPTFITSKT